MKQVEKKYRCVPFWSWNDTLDKNQLVKQVEWMNKNGVGGFFMHARGGLKTEYLGKEWFESIDACSKRAKELGMEAYAYDENGWPSGFVGGKLLEDIENHDRYLTCKQGEYDENALASFVIGKRTLKKAKAGDTNCLNVYENYSTSTADILNPEVVDKFIAQTHEQYRKRDTYNLKGFFTDEPQYFRWDVPYTKVLPSYFEREYGENLLDRIGLLFLKKQGYRDFRYKYWKAMQSLMLESFAKKIYDWCDKYGYKLTGHYIEECCLCAQMECCGGIMPFYEYEHIPGIDYLGSGMGNETSAKQVGSVSAQLGKKQVLTETFAACGWDITPIQLKAIAESQYVAGVNLMCQHLLPYKEQGQRKRDYPAHFSTINPWIERGFKDFNDYFSYLGKLLANSKEIVNVGVLHPIRSAYFDYERNTKSPYLGLEAIEKPFISLMEKLCNLGIGHHFLDEALLAKYGKVKGQKLILGKCQYDYVILPTIYTMDKTTEKLLAKYVKNGGKILLTSKKPQYLEGQRYSYDYLKSNTCWDEIIKSQPFTLKQDKGADIRLAHRRNPQGKEFIYCVNCGEGEANATIKHKRGKSFNSYDIVTDTYTKIPTKLHFDKGQSYILYIDEEKPKKQKKLKNLYLKKDFEIVKSVDNYLTLDMISYSLNGVDYTSPRHHMCVFSELLDKRYKGKVYLKYQVNINTPPTKCSLLAEDTNTLSVTVNGQRVEKEGESPLELAPLCYNVAHKLHKGINEIIVEIDYFQKEEVYYALFGENVTESLKNCLAYDTDIEPIYLYGNFGVYGNFKDHENGFVSGKDLYLDTQKSRTQCLITDGYPFFRGNIVLKQNVMLEDTSYQLVIPENFLLIDLQINGKRAGRMLLSSKLDISKYLQKGENEIIITLTVGNRNLLGPFHTIGEHGFVGPDTFERLGSWQDGKSKHFNPDYSFKKTII
ncbi:MAG: hypothetical protein IJA82_03990 [Clostridia bacterium]|nr:hypothetical protein [Clostridia bacterium]